MFSVLLSSFLGADPTLKDSTGYSAVDYAGSPKIKEFLNGKMETVCISNLNPINGLKRGLKSKVSCITPAPWCANYLTHAHNHITGPGIRRLALDNMASCRAERK